MQKFTEQRGGGLIIEFTTNHVPEVTSWVLSWGADATALSPKSLVDELQRSLKQTAANY
jgi:predicted DNA-binding transcriptional regulator YafY